MRYVSTRGRAPAVGFGEALLAGLAPDGGLYTPEAWPALELGAFTAFADRPYAEVAAQVLKLFAGEALDEEACAADCAAAYASFSHAAVAPLRQLAPGRWLLELFHGPTLAFKDVAMQLLARLYARALEADGRRLTIVVATSGDTGGAAVEAFRGSPFVDLVVLFPEGKISEVQRRFMTTTADANVSCAAVAGSFDDCQAMVKALFADAAFRDEVDLSGVNSINWARIVAQSVYYATAASALGATPDRPVAFAVPTGNFGDAFAGYAARRIGVPVERIVVATNANAILADALTTGRYVRGAPIETQSPAMDIQVASNFERLLFEALERDAPATRAAFEGFAATGEIALAPDVLARLQALFTGVAVFEPETAAQMEATLRRAAALIDPHTAVGVCGADAYEGSAPLVVLSTAHPAKFPDAVRAATGETPRLDPRHAPRMTAVERIDRLPADVQALKAYVRARRRSRL